MIEQNFLFSFSGKHTIKQIKVKSLSIDKNASIIISGSKSYTNRAVVLAGMRSLPVVLHGFLFSEDSFWGLDSLIRLGFQIECNYKLKIVKITPPNKNYITNQTIFLGKSGTLARFFPAVILNWQNIFFNSNKLQVYIDADSQLKKRPISPLIIALRELGANISSNYLPMEIQNSNLGGECQICGEVSGQFFSGLLLAASGSKNYIKINRINNLVQPNYIKMTINIIKSFGSELLYDDNLNSVEFFPQAEKKLIDNYVIEADASTACYFIALAFLHNFNLQIQNIGSETIQPDYKLIDILIQMGAHIEITSSTTHVYKRTNNLKPKGNFSFDFSMFSDQALTLGAIGIFADNPIEISGVSHIRYHESDRITCFVQNIRSLGLKIHEKLDGFIIFPSHINFNEIYGEFETWEDHRFAMTGFLIASMANNVTIKNPKCVEKTAPQFFAQAQELGFNIEIIEE